MNDPIERAFNHLHQADVPPGPPEELIRATLKSVDDEVRRSANHLRVRRRRLNFVVAAAAMAGFGLTLFTLFDAAPQHGRNAAKHTQPSETHSANVAGAFIEAGQLEAGQTFLLPLHGPAVCVDPATWPDDLLTI
jgi:hypothetical protein